MFGTILDYTYNRNQGVKLTILSMGFLTGDKEGHTFRIAVVDRQGPVDLTGASVTGWFIPNDQGLVDDQSVPLKGSVEGNVAILSLPPEAYLEEGRFSLVIKLNHDGRISTIFWGAGNVSRSNTDIYVDVGDVIPSLEELLDQIDKMEEATKETKDATSAANAATDRANAAADAVDELKADAEQAVDEAQTAVKKAGEIAASWENATAQANTVDYNVPASAELSTDENGNRLLMFDIPRGVPGEEGYTPQKGVDYFDGYTPQKGVDYFDGKPGEPGKNFTILGVYDTYDDLVMSVTNPAQGDHYDVGTEEPYTMYMWDDKSGWVNKGSLSASSGASLPEGGTAGQILTKNSSNDGDASWKNPPISLPSGGVVGQVLTKSGTEDGEAEWTNLPEQEDELPSGGTAGQVLAKKSDADNDAEWIDIPSGVPDGGTTGQVLRKNSDTNGDASWKTLTADDFGNLGTNPISGTENDTPSAWAALGNGRAWYNANGELNDKPETYGILINRKAKNINDVSQTFYGSSGGVYMRYGNVDRGWNGTWTKSATLPDSGNYTNLADNSDFTHWVAQAGISADHGGSDVYGGDRWIIEEGTVTGTANTDGDGYRSITLNGKLVQVVPSPPAVATAFVETVSGEATARYDAEKGAIVIESNGGIIKNVLLLEGEWTEKPEYVAKGYAAELLSSYLYFVMWDAYDGDVSIANAIKISSGENGTARAYIMTPIQMRKAPVIAHSGTRFIGNSSIATKDISVRMVTKNCVGVNITCDTNSLAYATPYPFGINNGYIKLSADIGRR